MENENIDPHSHRPLSMLRTAGNLVPPAPRPAGLSVHPPVPTAAAGALRGTPWIRPLPDARATSTTPDMLMLSPSTIALQQKYGAISDCSLPLPVSSSEEPSPRDERDDDMEMDEVPGKCEDGTIYYSNPLESGRDYGQTHRSISRVRQEFSCGETRPAHPFFYLPQVGTRRRLLTRPYRPSPLSSSSCRWTPFPRP